MSNFTATLIAALTYTNNSGSQVTVDPPLSVAARYQGQNVGTADVPDSTPSTTSFDIPFGTIDTDCTLGIIQNQTGQDLDVYFNGAMAASFSIPAGGVEIWANPVVNGGTPITSVSVKTTATQDGAGYINYWLFGDPV